MRSPVLIGAAIGGLFLSTSPAAAQVPAKYKPTIQKGLEYLVSAQNKRTGHWEGTNGQHPAAMTALAGMAMLCEGSTTREGKYAKNLRMARDWLMEQSQPNGLINLQAGPQAGVRYMYDHGFSMLFLASVYGEEGDVEKRRKLEDILTRGAKFSRDAQTTRGGWGYVTARDGNGFDEGSVTITQLQGLRAARNSGIKVPPEAIKDAVKYLQDSTGADGGVIYSLAQGRNGPGRPALTAAAICCGFSAGEYESPLVKKWLKFCETRIPVGGAAKIGHDEYVTYYYSQAMYSLGEDGWAKLFPDSREGDRLTWKKYRDATYDNLVRTQNADGSWSGANWTARYGQVYITSALLVVMQLDNNCLPIYQK